VTFAEGATLFAEGDEGDGLYIVLEGEVELRKGGRPVGRRAAGSFFGELSTLDGVPRGTSAYAAGPVRLLRLDREDFFALMEEVPALGIGLAQYLALLVRELEGRLQG
jgi:CRP-like cAMP-binding protein